MLSTSKGRAGAGIARRFAGLLFVTVLLGCSAPGRAQSTDSTPRIRIFLNCGLYDCFQDFMRSELSFFHFVRDMAQADVQVFILPQSTAAGGIRYTIRFLGQGALFGEITDSATVTTAQMDTEAQMREALLAAVQAGLAPYVLRTPWRGAVAVRYPVRTGTDLILSRDRWRGWVFSIGLLGSVDGESNRRTSSTENYANVTRITPTHKTVLNAWYEASRTGVTLDSVDVRVSVSNGGVRPYYAHALGPRWSVGILGSAWYDEYRNIRLHYRLAPAVEYNIFPHTENTRRQLRIGYQAGLRRFRYYDTTVYDKLIEYRPYQQLAVVAAFAQPWGSVSGLLQYNAYLDNLRQNRFSATARMSVRVLQGLTVTVDGSGSAVRDQISLSKRTASEDQLLLRGAQLPTSVLYNLSVGLAYTFGSTNNSIVNPRFNDIDN